MLPKKDVLQLIDYLTAEKYLQPTDSQFPSLKLTDRAVSVLRGELKVERKQAKRAEKVKIDVNSDLFEKLREVRRELAAKHKVPPYIIFQMKRYVKCVHICRKRKMHCLKSKALVR